MKPGWKISCREAVEWISRSEELALTRQQRIRLRLHIRGCILCQRFGEQHAWLLGALKTWPLPAAPLRLSEEELAIWERKFENDRQ